MLCPGGTYYLVGYGGTVKLPAMQLVLGEITIAGNLIGTRADLEDLVMLTAQGKVVLHSTRYPLDAANDAIDDLRHGRIRSRAILSPGLGSTGHGRFRPYPHRRPYRGGDLPRRVADPGVLRR